MPAYVAAAELGMRPCGASGQQASCGAGAGPRLRILQGDGVDHESEVDVAVSLCEHGACVLAQRLAPMAEVCALGFTAAVEDGDELAIGLPCVGAPPLQPEGVAEVEAVFPRGLPGCVDDLAVVVLCTLVLALVE